jgi:tetratricopeptide (TPR) repeat protein
MAALARQPKSAGSSTTHVVLADSPARFLLLSFALIVAILAVYWPVHTHPFMPADDNFYVADNVYVHQGLRWSAVKWAFTTTEMVNWIPLTWLAHAADYQMFGADPAGHHIVNVLLHALAAWLLFWTLRRATGFIGRSFMVAALFALHPINVEPVAWVAELKTMLSMIFLLLALDGYRWYAAKPGIGRYSLVALFYALGLMAKSQIIMLPFVLLLWDYWPLQRMFPASSEVVEGTNELQPMPAKSFLGLVAEKIPLFVLAILDAVVTLYVQGSVHPGNWKYSHAVRLENAIVAYVRYLGKAFWPQWLSIYYPHPGDTLAVWQIAGAAALLVAITILVLLARSRRYLLVGWFWFAISLVPMSGVVHFGDQAMADRYAYQPLCGIFLLICWSAADWSERRRFPVAVLAGVSVAILLALTALTYRQVNYWRDDITLWSHALQASPDNVYTEQRLTADFLAVGRREEAMQHLARAVSFDPSDAYGNLTLAFYEHEQGNLQPALDYYRQAIRAPSLLSADKRQAMVNMGHIYEKLGDAGRARQYFEAAANIRAR